MNWFQLLTATLASKVGTPGTSLKVACTQETDSKTMEKMVKRRVSIVRVSWAVYGERWLLSPD